MDQFLGRKMKFAVLIFAILLVSACSSSSVDQSEGAPETAASTEMMSDDPQSGDAVASSDGAPLAEANTDAVPPIPEEETPPPPADLASAPTEAEPAPASDVAVASADTSVPPPAIETPDVDVESKPAVSENPSLAEEPAPTAFKATETPPPAPLEEPTLASSGSTGVSGEVTRYRVKRGDTLMKIAFENYGDLYRWKEILDGNQNVLKDPNQIAPGTFLMLSGAGMVTIERNGEKYLIKTGDTLGLISNEVYGTKTKWKKLWENNRQLIKNPNRIYAGFNLYYIPEGRMTRDQSLPFNGSPDPEQVATGPATGDAERVPNSQQ
ncbi:MAG: LysM peptidoglycan-binding domain-containing protein [Bdellovibrionales bacterium]|nr:LysM peptidoglycan-binding domain-containing protein [Bdellovibrionales bacterium]